MRKWMRERISRKKSPQEGKEESAQAPLQPAYFDGQAPSSGSPKPPSHPSNEQPQAGNSETTLADMSHVGMDHSHSEMPQPPEPVPGELGTQQSMDTAAARRPYQQGASTTPGQGRRRRGRGGRGRGGPRRVRSVAVSDTPAPAAVASGGLEATEAAVPSKDVGQLPQPPIMPRVPKGVVVLAIGLPGSGKSSWFKRHNISPLSSDLLRALLFDDPTEQRFQDLVFSNLRSMLKARLIARRPLNYVDATNLTSHDRRGWIKLAKDYGYEVQAVFFDVPLDVCLDRNRKRERVVSEDVMRRMAAKQKPPTFEEGFSKITVVRVKQK
jgi:predicted kinase